MAACRKVVSHIALLSTTQAVAASPNRLHDKFTSWTTGVVQKDQYPSAMASNLTRGPKPTATFLTPSLCAAFSPLSPMLYPLLPL